MSGSMPAALVDQIEAVADAGMPEVPHDRSPLAQRRLARRATSFETSPWDEIVALRDRHPDMISFGGGAPAREAVPVARLQAAAAAAWAEMLDAYDYGELAGYAPLRELIAARMARQGMGVDPDDLIVTNGSQQGIDLVAKLMLDPGDTVVIETPAYIGALQTFAAYEATYLPVPVDDQGLRVDVLERELATLPRPPKLIYTVPTFHNPTGVTLPRDRREALLALARHYGILVVEDDPYGELRYDGAPEPPLRALDPDVVYLGTFSKTLAPALRVGWLAAPRRLAHLLAFAKESVDVHNERLMTRVVYHAADGFLDHHLVGARDLYRGRRDTLLAALSTHLPPGTTWTHPEGGFFVWVELADGVAACDLLPRAAAAGVLYLPGAWFSSHADRRDRCGLRLSFSTLDEVAIREGVRRLGEAVRDHVV
jgi:2-aminoadipate transaminase